MTRSLWKGPFSEQKNYLSKNLNANKLKQSTNNKIWSRRSVILPVFLNKDLLIYNGRLFIPLKISEEMIGHKYGEFASTRKKPIHKKKRK